MTLSTPDLETLTISIQKQWPSKPGDKATAYVNQFKSRVRVGTKIVGQVVGNHGTYIVSIQVNPQGTISSACSCYIGKHGFCHHCAALAETFLKFPDSFVEKVTKKREEVTGLEDVAAYLEGVTLESLLTQLKEQGISQKVFAESIGMST